MASRIVDWLLPAAYWTSADSPLQFDRFIQTSVSIVRCWTLDQRQQSPVPSTFQSINFSHDRTKAEQEQSFVKDTSDIITRLPLPCPCRRCRRAAALRRSFSTKPTARSDSIQPLRIESDELNKEYLSRDGSDIVRLQGWTELDPPFSSMNGAEGASVQQHSIHRCPRSISLVADENRSPQSSTSFWFLSRRLSKISLLLINY